MERLDALIDRILKALLVLETEKNFGRALTFSFCVPETNEASFGCTEWLCRWVTKPKREKGVKMLSFAAIVRIARFRCEPEPGEVKKGTTRKRRTESFVRTRPMHQGPLNATSAYAHVNTTAVARTAPPMTSTTSHGSAPVMPFYDAALFHAQGAACHRHTLPFVLPVPADA